jgi:hypothetical protein
MNTTTIINGDCIKVMRALPENTIDSILTDPPYGLNFMSKKWDHGIPGPIFWEEALRLAKPGSFMLAFGGTRTYHRLMCSIEDSGWRILDCLMWVHGMGFPKGLNISKAIDKKAGLTREIIGIGDSQSKQHFTTCGQYNGERDNTYITAAKTDEAKHWDGYCTQLKPAWEPIILCQKELDGTFADNVLKWSTGALNIDKCRIPLNGDSTKRNITPDYHTGTVSFKSGDITGSLDNRHTLGRYPANLLHDGSEEVVSLFPYQKSGSMHGCVVNNTIMKNERGVRDGKPITLNYIGGEGSAARFFYCAKAHTTERNYNGVNNDHPTVKPIKLLSYLARLITPPNGTILDPFAGSGSMGIAATEEGFSSILVDIDKHYCDLAKQRNNVVDDIIILN